MSRRLIHTLFVLLCMAYCTELSAQEIQLRLHYPPDSVFKYKTTVRQVRRSEIIPTGQITIITEEMYTLKLHKVREDSSMEVIMTILAAKATVNQEKTYHEHESLKEIPLLLTVRPNGKVLDFVPMEELSSKKERLVELMKKQHMVEEGYPDRLIKVGETWTTRIALSEDLGELKIEELLVTNSKLVGFETIRGIRAAVLGMNMTVQGTVTTTFEEVPVRGTGRGAIHFDFSRGRMIQQWIEFDATSTVETRKGPQEIKTIYAAKTELIP